MGKRVVVYHAGYGCDTGCCGHVVEVDGVEEFSFSHPYGGADHLEFAKRLVREEFGEEHVADLDWSQCTVSED